MTEEQANNVLRATAEHALTMIEFLYGKHHEQAAKLINEALVVNKVTRDNKDVKPYQS